MYTSHGHLIDGTPPTAVPDTVARCGGPGLCDICSKEAAMALKILSKNKTVDKPIEKGPDMEFTTFVRKPFTVEAVEVTEENIADIAEFVGTLREKDDGTPYIQVDRRLVPNIFRVYPGFWMTRMGDNIRCYSKRIFTDQFTENTPHVAEWVRYMNGGEPKDNATETNEDE